MPNRRDGELQRFNAVRTQFNTVSLSCLRPQWAVYELQILTGHSIHWSLCQNATIATTSSRYSPGLYSFPIYFIFGDIIEIFVLSKYFVCLFDVRSDPNLLVAFDM